MRILKELPELVSADILTQETADKIHSYYQNKPDQSANRLFIVFGILGAVLVGLGIILILAHNWDELSKTTKTVFAFLPVLIGQLICGYTLLKKRSNTTWIESSSAFLFFAVGASISLVSQIYNIPGDLSSFILSWMLLCVPLVYIMNSSITSLLYLIGITNYACEIAYFNYPYSEPYIYWLLLLLLLPHYYLLFKRKPEGNFMVFHNWLIPLSIVICLGSISKDAGELMFGAYFSLFGFLYLVSKLDFFSRQRARNSGYKLMGALGTLVLLLVLSFDWFWVEMEKSNDALNQLIMTPEFLVSFIFSTMAGIMLYLTNKGSSIKDLDPIGVVFLVFIPIFLLGFVSVTSMVLINLLILAIGLLIIRNGAMEEKLGELNFGLLIITALITCRFFDTEISFVIRGILFLCVGVGFFMANYLMLKKRQANG